MIPIDGFVVVDKPEGVSSFDVVRRLKRLLNPAKIGHAGTLDPLAQGVLVIALGEGTKLIDPLMGMKKDYTFSIAFGQERTSGDREGDVCGQTTILPTETQLQAILPSFIGDIMQVPPIYSAIKVNGRRAYKLARSNQEVVLAPRQITIHDLKLLNHTLPHAQFFTTCSKGTYIRSLGADIARAVGSLGHISYLRRNRVGYFHEKDAFSLEKIMQLVDTGEIHKFVCPLETMLDDILALAVSEADGDNLLKGRAVPLTCLLHIPDKAILTGRLVITVFGKIIGLGEIMDDMLYPKRMIQQKGDRPDVD